MFEVVVTYRSDFREEHVDRFPTEEEAQQVAQRLAVLSYDRIVRAWVRVVRETKTTS